ncbi:MAG: hypothetical protein IT173_13765 [Acidobacteria bacterium]|nr:hypothetical protein [Acidobacteriota bacterium]
MKKVIKKVLLIILAVLIAIQAPFIYRRYKIGQLADKVNELNRARVPAAYDQFKEYKGIIHAHTNLGGHSTGSFEELIAAANANDLDFVIMTEHWSDTIDTAGLTLNGVYGKTHFIGGNEIDTADSDRFLMIPGSGDAAGLRKMPTPAVLDKLHAENRLAIVTYPEKFKSWNSNFDGIEVFSLHTNAKRMNPFTAVFDGIWSFSAYPELMLATYFKRPDENLRKFDEIAAKRNISLIAGTDAHSNIGFHLFGDDAGNDLLGFKLDPYEKVFRLVRQHVLIEKDKPLTRENLVEALRSGQSFVGFDVLGDTTGFRFSQCDVDALCVNSPAESRIALFKDGQKLTEDLGSSLKYGPYGKGVYRVEVYLDQLGPPFDKMPWIISNPIYVR